MFRVCTYTVCRFTLAMCHGGVVWFRVNGRFEGRAKEVVSWDPGPTKRWLSFSTSIFLPTKEMEKQQWLTLQRWLLSPSLLHLSLVQLRRRGDTERLRVVSNKFVASGDPSVFPLPLPSCSSRHPRLHSPWRPGRNSSSVPVRPVVSSFSHLRAAFADKAWKNENPSANKHSGIVLYRLL